MQSTYLCERKSIHFEVGGGNNSLSNSISCATEIYLLFAQKTRYVTLKRRYYNVPRSVLNVETETRCV